MGGDEEEPPIVEREDGSWLVSGWMQADEVADMIGLTLPAGRRDYQTVAGFVLWYAGAARISGAEAGLMTALVPVSAVALAALLLRERVSAAQLAGVACVLGAVLLATFGQMRTRPGVA